MGCGGNSASNAIGASGRVQTAARRSSGYGVILEAGLPLREPDWRLAVVGRLDSALAAKGRTRPEHFVLALRATLRRPEGQGWRRSGSVPAILEPDSPPGIGSDGLDNDPANGPGSN